MYQVNDYVVHNTMGVNQIVDILPDAKGQENGFYVLRPVFGGNGNMTLKLPVATAEDKMRYIMTRSEADELVDSISEQESIWIDDDKARNESFRACLKTGLCSEWAALIKTLLAKKEERAANGKNLTRADEDVLRAAQKNLVDEFAIVLDMKPDDVLTYIQNALPEKTLPA